MKTVFISLISISLFLSSCTNSTHENSNESPEAVAPEVPQQKDESQPNQLNVGEKWQVNIEMKPYIIEGQNLLNAYDKGDYKMLAKQLKEKNSGLIKSCTMGGKSHDELHKWLHPHLQLVAALENAKNEQEANAIIDQLSQSFTLYHTYFE